MRSTVSPADNKLWMFPQTQLHSKEPVQSPNAEKIPILEENGQIGLPDSRSMQLSTILNQAEPNISTIVIQKDQENR